MKFKQFYLGCLSHASYYLGSENEAVIIDPQRDIQQYLDEAESNGQSIKYIIETHSHADFVSGHIELSEKTGAEIIYGEKAETEFPTYKVKDGAEITIGKIKLKFIETPGHTPEGITIIAENTEDASGPLKMFTGDTLFIGDVGRPDLVGSKGFSAEEMAGFMYDSLHDKILQFPDQTEVYPAHGAGSLCGKHMSNERSSTIGEQRVSNYALKDMPKERFVEMMANDLAEAPAYFSKSAEKNLKGPGSLDKLGAVKKVVAEEVKLFDGVILDVRSADKFGEKHIPNSLNIGLGGQFAPWAGTLIEIGTPMIVIAATREQIDEAVIRLARVGHETVEGAMVIDEYDLETRKTEQVSVEEMNKRLNSGKDLQFVDVRREAEYLSGHARNAKNLTLSELRDITADLDKEMPTYVICQGGYRSSAGTSILEKIGFTDLHNVSGGTGAWIDAGLETEVPKTVSANS